MSIAIKAENLSKAYQIGQFSTGTISRDIERWWAIKRGKEDPFLKIGETNDRSKLGTSDIVWSLKDLNFEINQGDAVGIIGKNGAGKSTLLKILSKVTNPTLGLVKIKGRISSLLEVGTGFHPELTGRENIFLNGAILGMRRHEIIRKFDEIVEFSGVERYIDTPVKRYSSGMYVRLAFAVAAHLESEILIVDEVLAVGDAEFQKKCIGKLEEIGSGLGKTVIFVSHNLGMVSQLCKKGIHLHNGELLYQGPIANTINNYKLDSINKPEVFQNKFPESLKKYKLIEAKLINIENESKDSYDVFEKLYIEITYSLDDDLVGMNICYEIEHNGDKLACSFDTDFNEDLLKSRKKGVYITKAPLPYPLMAGKYVISTIDMGLIDSGKELDKIYNPLVFNISELSFNSTYKSYTASRGSRVVVNQPWGLLNIK
jgi:lipopolysaccharide transport system ATP-binding protein